MRTIQASRLREVLSEAINRVAFGGERIMVRRNNKDVAALVSVEDLKALAKLENRQDLEAIRRSKAKAGKNVDWEDLKRECDL